MTPAVLPQETTKLAGLIQVIALRQPASLVLLEIIAEKIVAKLPDVEAVSKISS